MIYFRQIDVELFVKHSLKAIFFLLKNLPENR